MLPLWLPVIFASDVLYTGSCVRCLLKCARGYANTPVLQTASSPYNVGFCGTVCLSISTNALSSQ